jgi:hypothetical protein
VGGSVGGLGGGRGWVTSMPRGPQELPIMCPLTIEARNSRRRNSRRHEIAVPVS